MAHGGSRPNAGRKKGSLQKKSQEIAEKLTANKVTPLEVMLEAMNQAYDAKNLPAAHAFAKDAAPYVHPKLAAMTHSGPNGGPVEYRNLDKLTDDELRVLQAIQTKLGDGG